MYGKIETGIKLFREKFPKSFKDVWYQENMMVSTIHSCIHIVLSTSYLSHLISGNLYRYLVLFGSSGYYLRDAIFVYRNPVYSKEVRAQYIIHHLFCLVIYDSIGGSEWLISRAFLVELTIPLTNWCMYLRRIGETDTTCYRMSAIIAGVLYFVVRILYGGYVALYLSVLSGNPLFMLSGIGLYSLSVFWMLKIIKKIKA